MLQVHEINDIDELAKYRLAWSLLLPQTRNATFFQSLDWLEVYWRHFGANQRLRALVVFRENRPMGIVPLVVRTERTGIGRLRMLTYPLDYWGSFYGPIGPGPTATLLAAMQHIRHTPRDWDLLDLRWVDRDGCDYARTPTTMRLAGFQPHAQAWDRTAMVDCEIGWEAYWQGRAKKWRHDVDRVTRRLAHQGQLTLVRYRPEGAACGDGDPRWDLYDSCLELAQRSWQGTATDGTTLCHPEVQQYLRDTHAIAARVGAVDLNLLVVDGRPVAFTYNYHYDGRIYGLRKGFDPEWAPLRVGTVLQRMMIEDSFRRGDRTIDLGVGSLKSKQAWQTSLATSFRYTHFPLSVPLAQVMWVRRWIRTRLYGDQDLACVPEEPSSSA